MTDLLKATCEEDHEWDVWAEGEGDALRVKQSDLRCPSCWAEGLRRFAISIDEPESLA